MKNDTLKSRDKELYKISKYELEKAVKKSKSEYSAKLE